MSLKQLSFLFAVFLGFSSFAQQEVFLENTGQITDQFGESRPDIYYNYSFGCQTLFIRKDGFELVSSIQLSEDEVQLSRMEFSFKNFEATSIEALHPTKYKEQAIVGSTIYKSNSFRELLLTDERTNTSIRYYTDVKGFKYDIILPARSSEAQFSVDVFGGDIEFQGDGLAIKGVDYTFLETMPSVYKLVNNSRVQKNGKYQLTSTGYRIEVDKEFDEEVIIDPYLTYATYYGGTSVDKIQAVEPAEDGSVYFAGISSSSANIATIGAYQSTFSGLGSFYLVKFDNQNQRLWGTYFQSSGSNVNDLLTDNLGHLYLSGITSSGQNLGTPGTHQVSFGGGLDAFIVKFTDNGFPIWSTLYGGNGNDLLNQMILEGTSIYLAGSTTSDSLIATPGAFQEMKNGSGFYTDGFLAKFDTTGQLLVGTYFGGSNMDQIDGLDFVDNGLYIAANLGSFGFGTPGTYQPTKLFNSDLFLGKLDPNLNVIWGTYFTGNSHVQSRHRIAVRGDKIAVGFYVSTVAGNTSYATPGTHMDTAFQGNTVCVLQFDTSGVNYHWGTYYDGDNYDYITDIFYPNDSSILICGGTRSTVGIATPNVHKSYITSGGLKFDVFVSCFNQFGQQKWGTYYGGEEDDMPLDAKIDNKNQLIVGGETKSLTGIPYGLAFQGFPSGNLVPDGFLFKLDIDRDSLFTDSYNELPNEACPKEVISIPYQLTGTFHPDNEFQLWISDENGDFTNPTLLGQQFGTNGGVFSVQLPNLIPGGNYKFQVNSTSPAVDGSITNPIAILSSPETNFTYQVGTNDVYFLDQSFSANTWLWDFGDGTTSTNQHPSNMYSSIGMYPVLLISDNGLCADSALHWVQIEGIAGVVDLDQLTAVYPNPTTNTWKVYSEENGASFLIHDMNGKLIQSGNLSIGETEIFVQQTGILKLSLFNQHNEFVNSFKLMRL